MNNIANQEQYRKTKVVPHDPAWSTYYDEERKIISDILKDDLYTIHHIGSTSVPGLAAKPVIDILVAVKDITKLEQYKPQLESMGYHWMGEYGIEGRRYLWKVKNEALDFHLQCYQFDHSGVKKCLIFRNFLIAHPSKALLYADAKEKASLIHPEDAHAYWEEKRPVVETLLEEALQWYENRKKIKVESEGTAYDLISQDFASLRDTYTERKFLDFVIEKLSPEATILDLGCGSGHPIASYLIEKKFSVTGIDVSKELLKVAQQNFPDMNFIYGDMRTITIKNKYDAVIAWDSFFHLPKDDQINMFSRFASWLKKGGILVFTSGDADGELLHEDMFGMTFSFYSLSPASYQDLLEKQGFTILLQEKDQEQHMVWIAKK